MFLAGIADYPKPCWPKWSIQCSVICAGKCSLTVWPGWCVIWFCTQHTPWSFPVVSFGHPLCCVQIASVLGPRMTIRVIIPLQYCPWLSICTALRLNQGEVWWRREDQRDLRTLDTRVRVRQACVETREGSIRIMNFQITVLEALKVFFMESSTLQTAWQNCLGNGIFSFPATIRWIWHFPDRFFGK